METMIGVRLSEQTKNQFNQVCKAHGATPSSYARILIERYLENLQTANKAH